MNNDTLRVNCFCEEGYEGDALDGCTDIDECFDEIDLCDPLSTECVNINGSYACFPTCNCIDPHENCILHESNLTASCICETGYIRDPVTNECIDDDECADLFSNDCFELSALCENTEGSYFCKCPEGQRPEFRS